MDLTALATLITISASAIVVILAQIQQSRCKLINLCCGFIRCSREIPDVEEGVELTDMKDKPDGFKLPDDITQNLKSAFTSTK